MAIREVIKKGMIIEGLDKIHGPDVIVFHAGTCCTPDGKLVTSGGRVLAVTGRASSINTALERAYGVIGPIGVRFDGGQYRRDIGWQTKTIK